MYHFGRGHDSARKRVCPKMHHEQTQCHDEGQKNSVLVLPSWGPKEEARPCLASKRSLIDLVKRLSLKKLGNGMYTGNLDPWQQWVLQCLYRAPMWLSDLQERHEY